MSFLKSLFSPTMQRATVIEHLIEKLARQADPCEWIKVLTFEQVHAFMTEKSAEVIMVSSTHPEESVVFYVWVGANDYDVRVSRALTGGVLITSKFAGTDSYSGLVRAAVSSGHCFFGDDDLDILFTLVDDGLANDRVVDSELLPLRAVETFFEMFSSDIPSKWNGKRCLLTGGGLVDLVGHGKCIVWVALTRDKTFLMAQHAAIPAVTSEDHDEVDTMLVGMLADWSQAAERWGGGEADLRRQ